MKTKQEARSPAALKILALQAEDDPGYHKHSELLYLMHELSRLISTNFDKAMSKHRLTHAQWWALMHVFRHEGVTQTEFATIMQMGRASVGKLLERLEGKRWISRLPDPRDSRVRRIYLNEEVVPVFKLMTAAGGLLLRDFLKGVSAEEEARLVRGLRTIRSNAERLGCGEVLPRQP